MSGDGYISSGVAVCEVTSLDDPTIIARLVAGAGCADMTIEDMRRLRIALTEIIERPPPVGTGELMRHALGVQQIGGRWKKPFRNHYVGNPKSWDPLVERGFARKTSSGSELTGGEPAYIVTVLGREYACAGITFKRLYGYGKPTNP